MQPAVFIKRKDLLYFFPLNNVNKAGIINRLQIIKKGNIKYPNPIAPPSVIRIFDVPYRK